MNRSIVLWLLLAFVVLVRLWSLSAFHLTDTTEARYGEIARVMAVTENWITPQFAPGKPFWAKPPLSFWQGAISIKLLGLSEYSIRLPAFLNFFLVSMLTLWLGQLVIGFRSALLSVLILWTTCLGFISAGAVMTDLSMLLATTLGMFSFWYALERPGRIAAYVFFFSLALGMLAKGPIAWVMIGGPLIAWVTIEKRWSDVFAVIPIVEGCALLGLVALPWFLLAELETPGFLNYFFIGEHFQRYLVSGWSGDLYGTAHDEPFGTIWFFSVASFAPWSSVLICLALMRLLRRDSADHNQTIDSSAFSDPNQVILAPSNRLYLVLMTLWPMVFFSLASNIIPTYVMTALPSFAILTAVWISNSRFMCLAVTVSMIMPLAMLLAEPLGILDRLEARSQARVMLEVRTQNPKAAISYVGSLPHSSRYYSNGKATLYPTERELLKNLSKNEVHVIFVRHGFSNRQIAALAQSYPALNTKKFDAYLFDDTSKIVPEMHTRKEAKSNTD